MRDCTYVYLCTYRYADTYISPVGRNWVQATLRAETRGALAGPSFAVK